MMRRYIVFCAFLIVETVGMQFFAATINEAEMAKLRIFLSQESAEEGVWNYQQIGLQSIEEVTWGNIPGLSWNSVTFCLERVYWPGKKLSGYLDFSGFEGLKDLYCSFNDLKSVNVRDCPLLQSLDIYTNDLSTIDVTTNPQLFYFRAGYNHFRSVDLSNNPELNFLCVTGNQMEQLDLSNKERLATVTCAENQIHTLNIENCVRLETLLCDLNQIASLNLYNLPRLQSFFCRSNRMNELQLYNCISLQEFVCSYNDLSVLDFSGCENLSVLRCENNQLTSLNMEGCERMTAIYCDRNLLSSLDVSQMPLLSTLSCKYNNLTFQTLPVPAEQMTTYSYTPQNYVSLEFSHDDIDMSDLYSIYDNTSIISWRYQYGPISPLESNEGLFTFDESYVGKTLICLVQNSIWPLLVMHYDVTLAPSDVGNLNPENNQPAVYANGQSVHVVTDFPATVSIYSLQGALWLRRTVGEGHTRIPVERGIYVVVVNDKSHYKVIVG